MRAALLILRHLLAAMLAALALAGTAQAQTATAEWSSLGVGALTPAPNPGSMAASDSTSVAISYGFATNGGTVAPGWGGSYVTYYTANVGGVSPSLLLNLDNSTYDPGDKVTLEIALGRGVSNLAFTIADIDQDSFRDTVEVYYDIGDGVWRNAADLSGAWSLGGGNVRRINNATANGFRGQGASSGTDTSSNVNFAFGATSVSRVRIVYFSWTGSGNPTAQYVALSRLSFDSAPPAGADLSLSQSLLTASPTNGNPATFRLTVTSAASSSETATGIAVRDVLPAGFAFTGASGTGSYNSSTSVWTVGSLAPGQSVSIDITGTVTASAGASLFNSAEIIASSAADIDSTPNNGSTIEDDYASATLVVGGLRAAGTPPTLACTAGSVLFDWGTRSWSAGSTSNSYALGTLGNIGFALGNPGLWLNNATLGGQSPVIQSTSHGGTFDASLIELVNLPDQSSEVVTTITLPVAMAGAQFTVFDVDHFAGQFADRIEVVGQLNGTTVLPVLTNGVRNYVIGNEAFGDSNSENDSADGNVVVTFTSPVDTIVISYGNHSAAPVDPGQQAVSLHDLTFCLAAPALDVTKISRVVSDEVSDAANPFAIPGALVEYCIALSNSGTLATDNVVARDPLPAGLSFVAGSIRSGNGCATATDIEDDNASGPDDSDLAAANWQSGTVEMRVSSIAPGGQAAFTFQARVN